ncbi:hypothetical protein H0H93_004137, partial [Arthromyces matolae]
TNKQMNRVLERLSQCNCKIADAHISELHRIGDRSQKKILGETIIDLENGDVQLGSAFTRHIFLLLTRALPDAGVKSVAKGPSDSSWPASPTDLLPSGADAFAAAILQWQEVINDTTVFAFIGRVLRLCQAYIVPSIASHSISQYV